MKDYTRKIKEIIDTIDIKLVSKTSNIVYKVTTKKNEIYYIKFYQTKSSHIDNELKLYDILDKKYLKEVVETSNNPKYAIFKELKGKTIDELNSKEIHKYRKQIIDSVVYFYETTAKIKINKYGLLDNKLNGTYKTFQEFIINRQKESQEILKNYTILNNAFTLIYNKYNGLLVGDNSLVPIDTNLKNIMITDKNEIKFIDPGELISGPILMGYGDFVAHTYKTELYEELIKRLKPNEEDLKRLRIYAIFSSLNILAFLEKLNVGDITKVIPYGNKLTFCELIKEQLKELKII